MNDFKHMSWDTLPDMVLSNIFQHLCNKDRYSASLVCKSWSNAFRSPVLWRKMSFEFPWIPEQFFDESPFKFVKSLGDYLKELQLEIVCWGLERNNVEALHNFMEFLLILTLKPPSLKKFTFTNLKLNHFWRNDWRKRKVETLIQDFLSTQSELTYFNMEYCEATVEMGINCLRLLAKNNARSLRYLGLVYFFESSDEVLRSPDYYDLMGSLENLVELSINFSCIDSIFLENIIGNCSRSLEILEIVCTHDDQKDHVIPNANWSMVRKKRPQLEVRIKMIDIVVVSDYINIISSEMGLNSFSYHCEFLICDTINARCGLNAIVTQLYQFRETLETVNLHFRRDKHFDDRCLIELASSCRKLKKLNFHGPTSTPTVKELCLKQLKGEIHLEECSFVVLGLGNDQTVASNIKEIEILNRSILNMQGVKFTIFQHS